MISLSDLEKQALALLPKAHADYFIGGSEREVTVNANLQSFDGLQFWPRVLRGNFEGDLNVDLLGSQLDYPILAAPTAFHKLAHPEGELATARAIARCNSLMIVSMASNTAIETITEAAYEINPRAGIWLQIYIQPDRDFTRRLIRRAEESGCKGLVVTVDSPVFGVRERDIRNNFSELPEGLCCANMKDQDGIFRDIDFDSGLNWNDIAWLRDNTQLPIILKGILHPEDIRLAIEHNLQSVMVSNHGGRQLDSVPATIHVLPFLAQAADGRIPLLVDGGIRSGSDVLKALALGANAVAIGRPVIWGLAVDGERGVQGVFQHLQKQLLSSIKLCGCRNRDDINSGLIFTPQQPRG